jgi:hypothetical protein
MILGAEIADEQKNNNDRAKQNSIGKTADNFRNIIITGAF